MLVVVVGAGFAGLMSAHRIAQASHEVVVLETRDRVGGRVWSQEPVTTHVSLVGYGSKSVS